jgi:hypothetical protein
VSIFQRTTVTCPACDGEVAFDLAVSVSADRRPDLRAAILAGTFQREPCPLCGAAFRVEPEFTYLDLGRGQYIGAWPCARRADWRAAAARTQAGFDRAFGAQADVAARAIGDALALRVVFGWPALVEKILAAGNGLDDLLLEAAKVALLGRLATAPLPGRRELRLVAVDDAELTFGWVSARQGRAQRFVQLPRTLIGEIGAEPSAWQRLFDQVADGPVVDFQREMLAA